jgi:hypothetical protein
MTVLLVRVPLHDEHQAYSAPRNASELLEVMSKFCLVKEFSWKIGDGEWEKETVAFDYDAAVKAYLTKRRWYEFWK